MASTDALPVPKKNTAFRLYFSVIDASGEPVTAFSSPDSERSLDGAAYADCTNEATFVGHGSGYVDLTAAEMNTDHTAFWFTCTEGHLREAIHIYPEEAGDIRTNTTQWSGANVAAVDTAGYPKVTVKSGTGTGEINLSSGKVPATVAAGDLANDSITANVIATGAIDADALAADAITAAKIAAGAFTAAKFAAGAIDAAAVAADAGTEIATAVWASAVRTLTALDEDTTTLDLDATIVAAVNTALDTAIAELSVAAPTATPTIRTALMLLYMAKRNAGTSTATTRTVKNNAGTTICTAPVSDDGTTLNQGKLV
jgi:hypothetical protein